MLPALSAWPPGCSSPPSSSSPGHAALELGAPSLFPTPPGLPVVFELAQKVLSNQ